MDDWKQFDEKFRQAQQRRQEQEKAEQEKGANMNKNEGKATKFVSEIAQPAFREIEEELRGRGMKGDTVPKNSSITIHVFKTGGLPTRTRDFAWTVEATPTASGIQLKASGTDVQAHRIKIEPPGGVLLSGELLSDDKVNKDDIVRSFFDDFGRACR
jgi:hypothetical protein